MLWAWDGAVSDLIIIERSDQINILFHLVISHVDIQFVGVSLPVLSGLSLIYLILLKAH